MNQFFINSNQLSHLIINHRQKIKSNTYTCSCFDVYLEKTLKTPLFIPGGDLGQIAILFSAANSFGFEINKEKLLAIYFEFLKGQNNFFLERNCYYLNLLKNQPEKFQLEEKDIKFLEEIVNTINQKPSQSVFQKDNCPQGVIMIKGYETIPSRSFLKIKTVEGEKMIEIFLIIFQQTLFEERQKILAKKLFQEKVVKLFPNLNEEYLAMSLIETGEEHFYFYINNYAKNLPLYQVFFKKDLQFEIKDFGKIIGVQTLG